MKTNIIKIAFKDEPTKTRGTRPNTFDSCVLRNHLQVMVQHYTYLEKQAKELYGIPKEYHNKN